MKFFFVINKGSGRYRNNWQSFLKEYFARSIHEFTAFELEFSCATDPVKQMIATYKPQRVVAIGGDGTVKLLAGLLLYTGIPLGILPAGSANGLAKELKIPEDAAAALDVIINGSIQTIHVIQLNKEYCIHLSDIGLNALMIRVFDNGMKRGKMGYLMAALKVIFRYNRMNVDIQLNDKVMSVSAVMIVIANATRYGTGALINPIGKLTDDLFEVVVIKQISFKEIDKMMVSHISFDPAKTEVLQTSSLTIYAKRKVHLQVDGEYLGKVSDIHAKILPGALQIIVP
ncbi:MAG: YegS/Rv2252/BmrU family lipid kinase [Chitinophagaceae bacterium]